MSNILLAPNDNPSNLTPEQYRLVRTPAFKAWFGDWENDPINASKVVDENGEPLVVYHGSYNNFIEFETPSYFAIDKNEAKDYGKVKPYFLKITNPYIKHESEPYITIDFLTGNINDINAEKIKEHGYDGISNFNSTDSRYIVAFEPNQIKLADGSNTKFDSENPDIRFENGSKILLAPNGNPSNLTPEQYRLVRTPEFKAWFGDWENSPRNASKVIDKNGEPLVVYHGSSNPDIHTFDATKAGTIQYSDWGKGIYFTPSKSTADYYSNESLKKNDAEYNRLYEKYIKTNVYEDLKAFQQRGREMTLNENTIVYPCFLNVRNPRVEPTRGMNDPYLAESAISRGQDGIFIMNNINFWSYDEIVVFNSNQIKIADGSNTTFDSNSNDIHFENGGKVNMKKQTALDIILEEVKPFQEEMTQKYIEYINEKTEIKLSDYDIEMYRLNLVLGLVKSIGNYLEVTDIVKEIKTSKQKGSIIISCIVVRNEAEYNFTTEVIIAGGYNIQQRHLRYIVHTRLPHKNTNIAYNKLNENYKKLTKAQKIREEISYAEKAIERYTKSLEEAKLNAQLSDDEVEKISKEQKPNDWRYQDISWETIVERGADKNYDYDKNKFEERQKEYKESLIKFWRTFNANIKQYEDRIKREQKEIYKLNKKLIELNAENKMEDGGEILLAPNGNPSSLTPEQYSLVRTPEFKAWFGDWESDPNNASKIVDENGEPLVVYHGSREDFNIFKYGQLGFHFGTKEQAERIVERRKELNLRQFVKPYFLNLKNPLPTIDFARWEWYIVSKILHKHGVLNEKEFNLITKNKRGEQESILKDIVFKKGYDGFKYHNEFEGKGDSFIVFKPNQIKLADGSNTTFDNDIPDVRYVDGGEIEYDGKKFWGTVGAGVLPFCIETKRFLIALRSDYVNEPNEIGIWGGKVDEEDGETEADVKIVAEREFVEETLYKGKLKLIPAYVFKTPDESFVYYNYIGVLQKEFKPELDWETENYKWLSFDELVNDSIYISIDFGDGIKEYKKHFGLIELLNDDKTLEELKQMINNYSQGGQLTTDKKAIYKEWKELINMSYTELKKFYDSEEGKEAGLSANEAKELGIRRGRESAKWIMKMKKTPVTEWSDTMWEWAEAQIRFVKRMTGNKGSLYDDKGNKTRKHTSLLIWGNNPEKKQQGGVLDNDSSNDFSCISESYFEYVPINEILPYLEHDREIEPKWGDAKILANLMKDIDSNGILQPITLEVYNGYGIVTEGNTRATAARLLGVKYIPLRIVKRYKPFSGTLYENKVQKLPNNDFSKQKAMHYGIPESNLENSPMAYGFNSIVSSGSVRVKYKLNKVYNMLKEIDVKNALSYSEQQFLNSIIRDVKNGVKHNKVSVTKLAKQFGIDNQTTIKELSELSIAIMGREISLRNDIDNYEKYHKIVDLYKKQLNISHRTSQSILMQQYSTPCYIGFLLGLYCEIDSYNGLYFEPSAGNGLTTIASKPSNFIVNEIDEVRNSNLQYQNYKLVLSQDASQPFTKYIKHFDAVITNPPFGTMDKIIYEGIEIKSLEQYMCLIALETMKDNGKAALIIGGHTTWDEQGRITSGKNRNFFVLLYKLYNVEDVININGAAMYSKQGTSFDTRIILINGRKAEKGGLPPLLNGNLNSFENNSGKNVSSYEDLWQRVNNLL